MSIDSIELGDPAGLGRPGPPRARHLLIAVAAAGLGFQAVHSLEHLLQLGYWLLHPASPAWLTPWAAAGRDALAAVTGQGPMTGMELLHLLGNAVSLAGLCATLAVLGRDRTSQALVAVTWLQAAHLAEHVALTATTLLTGEAIGLTTAFGAGPPGPAGTALRVWAHFAINLGLTLYALRGCASFVKATISATDASGLR
jgi:hypothetical protein